MRIVIQNNKILGTQQSSVSLLNKQFKISSNIQTNIISSSKNLLTTIDTATKAINDNLTGGNGILVAKILTENENKNFIGIFNLSKNTIPDVVIKIWKYDMIKECKSIMVNNVILYDYACDSINMISGPAISYGFTRETYLSDTRNIFIYDGKEHYLEIMFSTPKQKYFEQLAYSYNNKSKEMRQVFRLVRVIDNKNIEFYSSEKNKSFSEKFDKIFDIPMNRNYRRF